MSASRVMRRAVSDEDKSVRRDAILRAAKRVFAKKGFQATTMADVAKAARLSYGSVYWYFESKDALFHALMDSEEAALRDHIAAAVARIDGPDPYATLRGAVQATFEFFEADRATVTLLFRDAYALGGRFESHLFGMYDRFVADVEDRIVTGQRAGLVRDMPPQVVAFSVAALVGQLAYRRLSTDDGLDAAGLAQLVVSLLFEGLLPR